MEAKILSGVLSNDTNTRLQAGDQLLEYIRDESNNIADFEELDRLIGGLAAWMSSNNFRVSLSAMDILIMLLIDLKDKFKPYLSAVVPVIKERLGDNKDQVREKAQLLLQQIMQDAVSSPQKFLETLMEGLLVHKNWRVKEQAVMCISRTLSFFGAGQISVSKFVGKICDLLSDANSQVRSAAVTCLADIYQHIGVKVRIDLSKRGLPASKLQMVLQKFDEIDKEGGGRLIEGNGLNGEDNDSLASCSSSASLSSSKTQGQSTSASTAPTKRVKSATNSGAVDEATFTKAFSDVPHLNVYTQHDVDSTLASIHKTLSNKSTEWDARIDSLKELRALIQLDIVDYSSFLASLKTFEIPINESIKDLRSQVVRETCVTLSCLIVHLKGEMASFCELVLPNLISLLPNSAKVMATSAGVCIAIMIKNCPSVRLVGPITTGLKTSKSAVTRKMCAEFLSLITNTWDTNVLDRAGSIIEESIVKGLKDSDPNARKFMRRAFWGYHSHYPTVADKLFDSLDSNVQKHLKDEKVVMNGGSTSGPTQLSQVKSKIKRSSLMTMGQTQSKSSSNVDIEFSLPPRPPSSSAVLPSIKVRPPTGKARRTTEPTLSMTKKISRSSENLLADGLGAPQRVQSKSQTQKTSEASITQRPNTPTKQRTGGHDSPARTTKSSSLSRKAVMGLSQEAVKQFGGGGYDDDDETGSITSERSSFSLSSEVSIMPYATAKYPNPITDLDELVRLCTSKSWSDRRDGIAQLHLLLESSVELTHQDLMKIRDIFKRMFAEPHVKVYGMFLETLCRFLEEHKVYIEDWIFLLLLKLLHKQGTDMLKSVYYKLQLTLENIRRQFEVDTQFHAMCRILTDQSQPMNNKVKQAWLEYMHELIPLMDSEDFKDSSETRSAFSKLLTLSMEPKSVEIRKGSQKVITDLFNLNTAGFSLMLRGVPRNLQENADRIIKGYLNDNGSSEDEYEPTSPSPFPTRTNATPTNKTPPTNAQRVALTPKGRQISSSSPDVSSIGYESPKTPRSRLPMPSGRLSSSGRMTPSKIPRPSSRQGGYPPRAQSVDPDRMMATYSLTSNTVKNAGTTRDRYQRPMSSQSEHISMHRSIGGMSSNSFDVRPPSSQGFMLDHFISHLPVLDFGNTEHEGETQDQVGSVLKELKDSTSSKMRGAALQSLFTLARNYDNSNWRDHIEEAVTVLLNYVEESEPNLKSMALRVLRELIKARPPGVTIFTEKLTNSVLTSFKETECNVSQASEDLFSPLAGALPPHRMLNVLTPFISEGGVSFNLGALKLLAKVVSHTDKSTMEPRLTNLVPGIIKGYCHEESNIRKASVFCLVEIHGVVGEKLRPYLTALSSSQTKLLDLYIKRHHPAGPKKNDNPPSSPSSSSSSTSAAAATSSEQ